MLPIIIMVALANSCNFMYENVKLMELEHASPLPGTFTFFPSLQQFCLLSGLKMAIVVLLLPRLVPRSICYMTILTDVFVRP